MDGHIRKVEKKTVSNAQQFVPRSPRNDHIHGNHYYRLGTEPEKKDFWG